MSLPNKTPSAVALGARAQISAADAVSVLCPGRGTIAPLFQAAAERYHVRPVVLVAMARLEAYHCTPTAKNLATHSYGLMGIKLDGSANVDHLEAYELMDPATNIELGARHLARWLRACGAIVPALAIYHGGAKRCSEGKRDSYAKRVMGLAAWAKRQLQRLQEKRA